MTDVKHAGLSPALVETIAGLSAGSIATLTVHPLDIVKTRMQIHRSTTSPSAALTTISLIRKLLQAEHPLAALYRGLAPNLVGNATSWASFFFFKSGIERAIATWKYGSRSGADGPASLAPVEFFVSSGLAGALTQMLTNPIWVLKTRMVSSDRSAAGAYPSMWAGAARLLRDEGPRGFYRGLGVGLLGVSHGAVQFAVYEPAKRAYLSRRKKWASSSLFSPSGDASSGAERQAVDKRIANEVTVALSTLSKLAAGAATYPLQVMRSRLQNYDAEERFGRGVRGVARQLWREEGIRGFYRGLVPGVVRVLPATWVTFLVYENVKYSLPRWAA